MIAERLFSLMNPTTSLRHTWSYPSRVLMALALVCPMVVYGDAGLDDYNVAVGLYKQQSWKRAETQFRDFLKTHSNHDKAPLARLYLGLTLVNLDDFEVARSELARFVKENPKNSNVVQARYRIAECSYLLNDLPAARSQFEMYLKEVGGDSFHDHALPYLADVQLRLNDPTSALATFQKAVERFPKGPLVEDAKFGWARSLEMLKRDDEAAEKFRELANQIESSRAADALFHLGGIAFERKDLTNAISTYSDLISRYPQSRFVPAAHLNLGYAYYQSDKFAEATRSFEEAALETSQTATASYWRGLCFKALKQYQNAADALELAAKATKNNQKDNGPSLETILFQQAICERHLEHHDEADRLFASVLDQWPKGELGDDSLHAMAEMAIESGNLPSADNLLIRFANDYPTSSLTIHAELLKGRLELAKAALLLKTDPMKGDAKDHYDAAARKFEIVLRDSKIVRTQNQARYFLAYTRQLQGEHGAVLQLIAPLVEQIRTDGGDSEFGDALVLQADSCQMEKQNDEAIKAVSTYLKLFPMGRQVARALSIQALAATRDRNLDLADESMNRLEREFPEHPMRTATLQQLADLSDENQDWSRSVRVYSSLIKVLKNPDDVPYALRGMGLAQFKQKQGTAAAETFAEVVTKYPTHEIAAECAYLRGESLREAGDLEGSLSAFDGLLKQIPVDRPASVNDENNSPGKYSYQAGLQVARLLRSAMKIDEADKAYEELLARFPKIKHLDKRLDEWALMNYDWGVRNNEPKRFERSDAIFRRLIRDVPDSELADNAKLSLAESDLIAGRLDEARNVFEELVKSSGSDQEVKERSHYQLIVLAVEQQKWNYVRELSTSFQSQFPESSHLPYAQYSLAEAILSNEKASTEELNGAVRLLNGIHNQNPPQTPRGRSGMTGRGYSWLKSSFDKKNTTQLKRP